VTVATINIIKTAVGRGYHSFYNIGMTNVMPKTPFFCQSVGMQDLSDEDEPIEPSRSAGERGRRGRIQHRANGEWRMAATRSSWEVSLSTMYAVTFRSTWMCIQQEAYDCWRPWQSWCEKYACV